MQQPAPCSRRQLFAAAAGLAMTLPVPVSARPARSSTLFLIGRSTNANVVNYDAHLERDGRLVTECPVHAYWVLRAEDGRHESLTWLERKLAYGFELASKVEQTGFRMRLSAVEGKEIVVRRVDPLRFEAHTRIAGQMAVIKRIYVRTQEDGIVPNVVDVALSGRLIASGAPVSELLRP